MNNVFCLGYQPFLCVSLCFLAYLLNYFWDTTTALQVHMWCHLIMYCWGNYCRLWYVGNVSVALHHPCTLTTRVVLTGFKVGLLSVQMQQCGAVAAIMFLQWYVKLQWGNYQQFLQRVNIKYCTDETGQRRWHPVAWCKTGKQHLFSFHFMYHAGVRPVCETCKNTFLTENKKHISATTTE